MKKLVLAVFMLLAAPLSAQALNVEENARLLREYVQVANEINRQLEDIDLIVSSERERQKLILSPAKTAAFCVKVRALIANLKRKDDLIQPGVIYKPLDPTISKFLAPMSFHERAEEATVVQVNRLWDMVKVGGLSQLFRPCDKKSKQ